MKTTKLLWVLMLSAMFLVSCGDAWPKEEQKAYMDECVNSATAGGYVSRSAAEGYCECTLNKLMKKFSKPEDITSVAILEAIGDCAYKLE
ncbi:MAG: hypothetical protein QF757_04545 [Candidatus Marinimicrobia bacterium]|nr:hypothetical protein [Candidatus Neomarinimicrobiota bacterium]